MSFNRKSFLSETETRISSVVGVLMFTLLTQQRCDGDLANLVAKKSTDTLYNELKRPSDDPAEEEAPKRETFYDRLVQQLSGVTVEPVTFCYACAMILHAPVIQQYVYQRISEDKGLPHSVYDSEASACGRLAQDLESATLASIRRDVQAEASYIHLGVVLAASVPSLCMALFLGSWSDTAGRRVIMTSPVVGGVIDAIVILLTMYFRLPLFVLFVGSFVNGLCGFFTTMILAVFSYIADVTEQGHRAKRLGMLEAIAFVSGMLSHLTSGWWIRHLGFKAPYWFILALHILTLFYISLFLPESRPNAHCDTRLLFRWSHVQSITCLFLKPRPMGRWQLSALMVASAFMMLSSIGFGSVIVLYALDVPFCCSPVMIGYFLADSMLVQAVGALAGFLLLKRCMSEMALTQMGIYSIIGSLVLMAFIKKKYLLFVVPLVGCLGGVCMPIIRAKMSKMVSNDEQGALFAAVATLETLCTLVGAAIFNSLYPYSVRQLNFKGFCFLIMALLMVLSSVIMGFTAFGEAEDSKELFKDLCDEENDIEVDEKVEIGEPLLTKAIQCEEKPP